MINMMPAARDAEIKDQLERFVRIRTGGTIRELAVVIENNLATIQGRTSTFYCKMLATHAALDVTTPAGIELQNDIEVGR